MQTFRGYFLCCIFLVKIAIHFYYLPNCTSRKQKIREFNTYILKVCNIIIQCGKSLYYLCTFTDLPQMEYVCCSVDCVFLCETIWIEFLWFRELRWVIVES